VQWANERFQSGWVLSRTFKTVSISTDLTGRSANESRSRSTAHWPISWAPRGHAGGRHGQLFSNVNVVETADRSVTTRSEISVPQCSEGTNRYVVVEGEHRGRRPISLQQHAHRLAPGKHVETPKDDIGIGLADAMSEAGVSHRLRLSPSNGAAGPKAQLEFRSS
jgi:hypothetical protein